MTEIGKSYLQPRVLICDRETQVLLKNLDLWQMPGEVEQIQIQSIVFPTWSLRLSPQDMEDGRLSLRLPYPGEYSVEIWFSERKTPMKESLFVVRDRLAGRIPLKVGIALRTEDEKSVGGLDLDYLFSPQAVESGDNNTCPKRFRANQLPSMVAPGIVALGIPHGVPLRISGRRTAQLRAQMEERRLLPGIDLDDYARLASVLQQVREAGGLSLLLRSVAAEGLADHRRLLTQAVEDGLIDAVSSYRPWAQERLPMDLAGRYFEDLLQATGVAPMAFDEAGQALGWTLVWAEEDSPRAVLSAIRDGMTAACRFENNRIQWTGNVELVEYAVFLEENYFPVMDSLRQDLEAEQERDDLRYSFWAEASRPHVPGPKVESTHFPWSRNNPSIDMEPWLEEGVRFSTR